MNWRFIPPLEATGATQMALDSWLFEQCSLGVQPPTLRFYTWSTPTVSLGRNQRVWPSHWQNLTWKNQPLEIIRRPTGGRAVLHGRDLTYAIALPAPTTNRRQAYESLCQFLIQGWQSLGVPLQFGQSHRHYTHNPNCFTTATSADLVLADGSKLIGSAQAWQGNTVLQHGSMQLHPDLDLADQVFGHLSPRMPPSQEQQTVGQFSAEQIMDALLAAAEQCFDAQFDHQPLCTTEWQTIQTWAANQALAIT